MPGVADIPDVEYVRAADEHGRLILHDPGRTLPLGSKVRLVPGHCDPTVNLYDWYVCYRNGRVEALWPITARGAVLCRHASAHRPRGPRYRPRGALFC